MKRSLQDWANLAEIIGTTAIIFSLVFVGFQISDNTKEMRSSAAHNATGALQTWYTEIGASEQVAQLWRKGISDPSALSKDEAVQFLMNIHSAALAYQNVYFLGTEGTLDGALYQAMLATMEASVPSPGFKWYWQQRSNYFTPEYRVFIENILSTRTESAAAKYR